MTITQPSPEARNALKETLLDSLAAIAAKHPGKPLAEQAQTLTTRLNATEHGEQAVKDAVLFCQDHR